MKEFEIRQGARNFDHDLNKLIIDIIPSLLAPRGNNSPSRLGLAFEQYFKSFHPKEAHSAALIQSRYAINTKYGLTTWNQGCLEIGILLGILANNIPAMFYLLIHVLADSNLLHDIRKEIEAVSVDRPGEHVREIEIMTMREKCVLLHFTWQEVLRLHALGSSVRYVRKDMLLQDKYLLKKGMIVQMPMAVMHSDPSWCDDVHTFSPRRFLKFSSSAKDKTNSAAYRPFGGGASLCPGRHFVTLEAMAFTATFIMRFDVEPVLGSWKIPGQKQESLATNVFPTDRDIRVRVKERQGYTRMDWIPVMA